MNGISKTLASTVPACMIALLAGSTVAQSEPDPTLSDESLQQIAEDLKNAGEKAEGIRPTRSAGVAPIRPHTEIGADHKATGRMLTEGSFIVQMEGLVHRASLGAWIFEPTDLVDEARIKPLIILPSQTLTRLIQIVGLDAEHNKVSLTGEVSLYRGRNYLLVTAITVDSSDEADESLIPTENEPDPSEPEANGSLSQSVQDLIGELEEARTADRAILQPTHTGSFEGGRAPVPEGRTFMRRRARLNYMSAGEVAVSFDNDPDQVIDAPLVVLPCHLLEKMEWVVENHGDSLPVRVSGQSFAYNGRSFIMPRSIVIERPSELDTRQ
ncbi:MAG: hypothetical protein Phyf2KO_21510 [Phycisphaerales bacterium]